MTPRASDKACYKTNQHRDRETHKEAKNRDRQTERKKYLKQKWESERVREKERGRGDIYILYI